MAKKVGGRGSLIKLEVLTLTNHLGCGVASRVRWGGRGEGGFEIRQKEIIDRSITLREMAYNTNT